jgi:hypothetical protein
LFPAPPKNGSPPVSVSPRGSSIASPKWSVTLNTGAAKHE